MHISRLLIENFRCIRTLDIALSPTSVIIGENNAGKTAVLDAVKIALSRKWGRSGQTGFNEYDFPFSLTAEGTRPEILICIWLSEALAGEWPQPMVDDLNDIIRTDPHTGANSICMQVTCSFESVTKSVEPVWQFLNDEGKPFSGAGARNQNLSRFFDYVPCFSMAAMRDAGVEFGGRSRFWGALLKSINVDQEKASDLEGRFAALNNELLAADPKLEAIKGTLKAISTVIANGAAGDVDVRAIPVNLWEIISRCEVVVQGQASDPWLPIAKHGHGVQSLAIIFLFRAFVENALGGELPDEAEPVLTLEEPEAHLHPQACRSLWVSVNALPGQKLITTHSPYFVQNVPFKDIIILRRDDNGPKAATLPRSCAATVPHNVELDAAIAKIGPGVSWNPSLNCLECTETLPEPSYRELLQCYTGDDRGPHHAALKLMREHSRRFIADEEVAKLESWAKRIRGEIFFANKWLLCEGQAEYAILGAIADQLGCPLDAHGISVIDYQNNGSPGAFAALARALEYPWAMICDGDQGGDDHIAQLKSHHFTDAEINNLVTQLPKGVDLEKLIVTSALRPCMLEAVMELSPQTEDSDEALLAFASERKEEVAVRIGAHIRKSATATDIPKEFRTLFVRIGACT
jgi:putative ATP-dependent endonuclease of the OLD family